MTDVIAAAVRAAIGDAGRFDVAQIGTPVDFSKYFLRNFKDVWWVSAPENIRPLRGEVDLFAVYDLIGAEGLPLVPCPRSEIVLELVEASDLQARRVVLSLRASEIVDDCAEVFGRLCESQRVGEFARFAMDAVAAFRGGAPASAQAMASVIVTTILDDMKDSFDETWSIARYPKKGDEFPAVFDEAPPYEFWVLAPLWHAYEKADAGDLVDKWGRHSSVHEVSDVHYNVANAVISLMFVASLLDFVALAPAPE